MRLPDELLVGRLAQLRKAMAASEVPALLTADPINISYATGARNMTVFGMMGASRFLLILAEGPTVLWEFAGCEHLAEDLPTVDEIRVAAGVTAPAGPRYHHAAAEFAAEVMSICSDHLEAPMRLGVERFELPVTDSLRSLGAALVPATDVFMSARRIKLPAEIDVMRQAIGCVEAGLSALAAHIEPGLTEVEIWSEFHRHLIATDGEYVSTRLAQGGQRTYPYFQEAGPNTIADGDLFCIDTDAVGLGGYAVDLSRTYVCGDATPTAAQHDLHGLAFEQLRHNASLLEPGRSFGDFARSAWSVPDRLADYRYYCLAHGLGLSGEHPNIPPWPGGDGTPYPLDGEFEPGMVICVESYLGDPMIGQGVKLEDQYLITTTGAERLTTAPFDPALA